MTIQNELEMRAVANVTTIIALKKILMVTARFLWQKTTRILNHVMCMEQNPSICATSAGIIQKMAQQKSRVTTLKNKNMMRISTTVIVSAADMNPQVNLSLPCQAMGKSTTNRVMAAGLFQIIISIFFVTPKQRRLVEAYRCGSQVPRTQNTCGAWFRNH